MIEDTDVISELNENYKIIKRPVRQFGTGAAVTVPTVFEDTDVFVLMKIKPTFNKGGSSKISVPKKLIGEEISIIIPKNLNYKTIHIDN